MQQNSLRRFSSTGYNTEQGNRKHQISTQVPPAEESSHFHYVLSHTRAVIICVVIVHNRDVTVIHKTGSTNVLHRRWHYDRQRDRKFRF